MARINLFCTCFFILFSRQAFAQNFNIRDYGAVTGQRTNNAPAIQRAIDSCFAHGGGTVLVPAGEFRTGTIHLKSHVTLFLENGALLLGISRCP